MCHSLNLLEDKAQKDEATLASIGLEAGGTLYFKDLGGRGFCYE